MVIVSRRVGENIVIGAEDKTVATVLRIGSDSVDMVLTNLRNDELGGSVLHINEFTHLAHGLFGTVLGIDNEKVKLGLIVLFSE